MGKEMHERANRQIGMEIGLVSCTAQFSGVSK
jgi:hypothetical protein